MGLGHSPHQPSKRVGELVPHRQNFELSGIPLLPYERQLAAFLGLTEAEYRQYRDELINSGKPRPAEYALIPDIRNEPISTTTILVNLAIGLALTAVSYLLMPKPRAPGKGRESETESIKLSDQTGRSRFNSVAGFDGVQQIAELGATIPIQFGRYEEHTRDGSTYFTGGFMASPQLVWSRMFSYGSHQGIKALYTIGECLNDPAVSIAGQDDPTRPDEAGIQIGTLPIDALPDQQQAVYWNTNYQDARVTAKDLIYGTRATPSAGDPQENDDIFNCPLLSGDNLPGFCMAYTPGGDTTFGFHSPISNGMGFMMNFRIIPLPAKEKPTKDGEEPEFTNSGSDPDNRIKMERRKIAGSDGDDRDEGMGTTGRGYSSQMGAYSLNGNVYENRTELVDVKIGDVIQFKIRANCFNNSNIRITDADGKVNANDVNNAINARRAAADDALQVGEVFMIGRTLWQVTDRTKEVWLPQEVSDDGNGSAQDGTEVNVTLKMIESTTVEGVTKIGMPGKKAIEEFVLWEGGGIPEDKWNGPSFWALGRASLAVVRNVRPAEVTEFGIRSRVWNQASGLCNFSDLPTPNELAEYEWEGNQLTSGTMSLYYKRTSCFTIWIRPVSDTGVNYPWKPIGEQFCVSGNQPVDQFNFISIKDLSGPRQMEFRFIPKNSAELSYLANSGEAFMRLDAKKGDYRSRTYQTDYGSFVISFVGEDNVIWDNGDARKGILYNEEYWSSGRKSSSFEVRRPSAASEYERKGNAEYGISSSYSAFLLGNRNPDDYRDQTRDAIRTIDKGSSKSITCKFKYRSVELGRDSDYYRNFNRRYYWLLESIEVTSVSGSWGSDETFEDLTDESNYYSDRVDGLGNGGNYGYVFQVSATITEIVNRPEQAARRFGGKTQINAYNLYDEVTTSASSGPEHAVVYVNETVTPANVPGYQFTSMGLALRSSNQINSIEQVRVWIGDGVRVKRWASNDYGPSNLFSDLVYYLLTDDIAGLGTWNSKSVWAKADTFESASKFLQANNIRFDGSIEEKVNLRSYLTEMAPLNLCNFVIANGQFAVVPALPYDPNTYEIKSDALAIKQVFSEGNIVDGSYSIEYLDRSERENFKAVMMYRSGQKNKTPQTDAILVRWNDIDTARVPQTVFDLSNFCTDKEQAKMIGRYMLSVRRRIDHAVTFQTSPLGLSLAPGDYIRVITTDAPGSSYTIGAISPDDGRILSATEVADGTHEVTAYVPGSDAVRLITLEVLNNCATDPALFGTLFTTLVPRENQNTYLVEQLELDENGLVNVTASHFPTGDEVYRSIIAQDVLDEPLPDGSARFVYVD